MANDDVEQEGFGLEYLNRLTFYDEVFEYAAETYEYAAIEHVEFTAVATRHSVNFVPTGTTYEANLHLYLKDGRRLHVKQEKPFFNRKQKQRSEAVMRAAGIFCNLTFQQRIETYERVMAAKGFVTFGGHQIARNGDLFRNHELIGNLLSVDLTCTLGPFQVECRKAPSGLGEKLVKSLWGGRVEVIDISVDRDCFLYIMKHYVGLTWRREAVPEKRRSGKELFNEALLVLGAKLCKVDGRVSASEISVFKHYFGIDETNHPGAGEIFKEAARSASDVREAASRIRGLLDGKAEPLEYILIGLLQVASADGKVDAPERTFIVEVGRAFGFEDGAILRLFMIFERAQAADDEQVEDEAGPARHDAVRLQCLEVLGLKAKASWSEIRATYRELARKHHPDVLQSQGVPIDAIRSAEEILKTINRAYDWLERQERAAARSAQS